MLSAALDEDGCGDSGDVQCGYINGGDLDGNDGGANVVVTMVVTAVMVMTGAEEGYDSDIGYPSVKWLSRWWMQLGLAVVGTMMLPCSRKFMHIFQVYDMRTVENVSSIENLKWKELNWFSAAPLSVA